MTLKPKGGIGYELRNEVSARLAEWRLSLSSWQALQKPGVNFAKNNGGGMLLHKTEKEVLLNE